MTAPSRVVILGGGFAGLACATALAQRGVAVTVLEARRTLGGRAASFTDEATGDMVDNGQHLFMACYRETREFLRRIGTEGLVRYQPRLAIDFVSHGRRSRLRCPPLPAPWHLLAGAVMLKGPGLSDRLALLRAAPELSRLRGRDATDVGEVGRAAPDGLSSLSVSGWLDRMRQTPAMRRWLWHPLAIATLNESPDLAPAILLASVLREGFLGEAGDSALGVATVGLGRLYTDASARFVESRGGVVRLGAAAASLVVRGARVVAVRTRDGEDVDADAFVAAVPPAALSRLGVDIPGLQGFASSPILSVNLWVDRPVDEIAPFDFAGVIGDHVQWVFNKERILRGGAHHLAAVISAARDYATMSNEDLAALAWQDLREHLPGARAVRLVRSLVARERAATFSATLQTEPLRPGRRSPWPNLLLAGDWTERGMPATIETAVRSGHRCAEMLAPAHADANAAVTTGVTGCGSGS